MMTSYSTEAVRVNQKKMFWAYRCDGIDRGGHIGVRKGEPTSHFSSSQVNKFLILQKRYRRLWNICTAVFNKQSGDHHPSS